MEKFFMKFFLHTIGTTSFARRIEWNKMMKWIDPKKDEKILDLACGIGELSIRIAKRGSKVYGIDINEKSIETAKELSKNDSIFCKFFVGDAENLTFPNKYFDKVISSSSLEHFDDDTKSFKEIYRVLKPKGSLILTVDSLSYPIDNELREKHKRLYHVVNYYDKKSLKEKAIAMNFHVDKMEYMLNSKLTSIFFNNLFIERIKYRTVFILVNLVCYPICSLSDKYFGEKTGYTLIAKMSKNTFQNKYLNHNYNLENITCKKNITFV